jgi:hypothetical protein
MREFPASGTDDQRSVCFRSCFRARRVLNARRNVLMLLPALLLRMPSAVCSRLRAFEHQGESGVPGHGLPAHSLE